jgi:hypothetical protein
MSRRWKGPVRGSEAHEVNEKLGELEKALPFHEHYDDVRFITTDHTWDPLEDHLVVNTSGTLNIALLDARLYVGRDFTITRMTGTGTIVVTTFGGQIIDGGFTYMVPAPNRTTVTLRAIYVDALNTVEWIIKSQN